MNIQFGWPDPKRSLAQTPRVPYVQGEYRTNWREIGVGLTTLQGKKPTGPSIYAVLFDMNGVTDVSLMIYGRLAGYVPDSIGGRSRDHIDSVVANSLEEQETIGEVDDPYKSTAYGYAGWFGRTVSRIALMDALAPFARTESNRAEMLEALGEVIAYDLMDIDLMRIAAVTPLRPYGYGYPPGSTRKPRAPRTR